MNIAIDFEYFFDDNPALTPLCVAVSNGVVDHAWWLLDPSQRASFLRFVEAHKADTFIAHAVEPAEGRCFHALGLHAEAYNWRDTFLESVILNNSNRLAVVKNSLVEVTKRLLGISLDSAHKEHVRNLIITRQHAGNEQIILDYCKSDVQYMLPIADKLEALYTKQLKRCKNVFRQPTANIQDVLHNIGKTAAMYAVIGMRGIPLDPASVNLLLSNAKTCLSKVQQDFNAEFTGCYETRKGRATRKMAVIQRLIGEFAAERNVAWERTPSGSYALAEKVLAQWKGTDTFPEKLRVHGKLCRTLTSFTKSGEKNWLNGYTPVGCKVTPSLFPYGTQSGRCAAKPKTGFVYTWGKAFRGLITPPKGKVLIEMDYSSQEVCISADWAGDTAMLDSYNQKDYYLAFMQKCGKFPADLALPTEDERALPLYKPYKEMRQLSKGCCLGLSYGMGTQKLAVQMGCPAETANEYKRSFEKVYSVYTAKRRKLKDDAMRSDPSSWCFSDGFMYHVYPENGPKTKSVNSLLNFPIQGAGSYMLRELVKICFARGIHLVATIHDAVVAMCDEGEKEIVAEQLRVAMIDASEIVTGTRHMKVGNPEYTYHGIPNAHGADKQWADLVEMLKSSNDIPVDPDTTPIFDFETA